jgi:crotonobetainyl-CoA:carnitine CoA-transferase CaiB-like acyl-CoA transferase
MRLLEGYTALDLTDLRGQLCGKVLRDLGMTVIKIEPPQGDPVRRLRPFAGDAPGPEGSLRFAYLNAGKQSVVLDLARDADRERLLGLVAQADVLVESFAPGTLAGLGLDAATLRARNPRLIVTSVTGFGQEGPYRDYLCPDLVGLAMGGLLGISGDPALPPVKAPETQGYYFASLHAALGTVLALWRRAHDGEGRDVDVAVQAAMIYHESLIRTYAYEGQALRRMGSQHPNVAPAEIFPTRDGYVYLFIAQVHWRRFLANWPDHPPELDDPKWIPNHVRRAEAAWINAAVSAFTRQQTRDELVTRLQDQGIPCLPVNSPGDFLRDEQVQYRRFFVPTRHPVLGEYVQPTLPVVVDGARVAVAPPPLLGEHTEAVLAGLGAASDRAVGAVADGGHHATGAGTGQSGGAGERAPAGGAQDVSRADVGGSREAASGAGVRLPGVRVLALTTGIAGPHASRALAQCGAEVIKLESQQGGLDSFRLFSPEGDVNASTRFIEANLNVLSAQLNLKHPEGTRLMRELAAKCDVVLDNFGADVLPRLGLGPDELRAANPELIVLKMPGLGCEGPRAHWRSWGSTLNAFTGMTYLWNHPGQERPIGFQGVYPDYLTAALVPALVFAALLYRQRTGHGVFLDLAQAEVAAYLLGVSFLEVAVNGRDPQPVGNDWADAAPHNCYPCAGEDRWCAIAVETDDQWRRLCAALGRPELGEDPRYATLAARRARLAEVDALVEAWTRERDAHAVMHALQATGVPCGAVQRPEDLVADPQLQARGAITAVEHPRLGRIPLAAVPLVLSDGGLVPARCAPSVGEHNAYVYCDLLGYSPEQLAAWQAEGVVE